MKKEPNIIYVGHLDQLPPIRPKWKAGDVVVFIKDDQHCEEGTIGVVAAIGSVSPSIAFIKTKGGSEIYCDICAFYTSVEVIGTLD